MECEIFLLLLLSALLDLELILRKVFTKKHSRKVGGRVAGSCLLPQTLTSIPALCPQETLTPKKEGMDDTVRFRLKKEMK